MIMIYRVQDHEGRGPYRPHFSHHWTDPDHEARNPLDPRCMFDPLTMHLHHGNDRYGYGFRTIEQAADWFTLTEMRKLMNMGYNLVVMEVDKVLLETDRQLLFWRNAPLYVRAVPVAGALRLPLPPAGL